MGVSGIILAGGRSLRMGRDKTLLLLNNETLIERTIKKLQNVVDEIIIASNQTEKYNFPGLMEVIDTYPGVGPLGGLHAGLMASRHRHAFVISGDMPLFTEELARYLLERREGYDVVVPNIQNRWEPLCAVYSKKCIEPIESCLQTNMRNVHSFYSQVKVLKIAEGQLKSIGDLDELFCNLNTPEDFHLLSRKNIALKEGD